MRIGVFDRDGKGTECFENLKKHQPFDSVPDAKINHNKLSGAVRLPVVVWGSPYDRYLNDEVSIELLFPFAELSSNDVNFDFLMGNKKLSKAKADEWIKHFEESPDLFDDVPFRVVPRFKQKLKLANRLAKFEAAKFQGFATVFKTIEDLLKGMKS